MSRPKMNEVENLLILLESSVLRVQVSLFLLPGTLKKGSEFPGKDGRTDKGGVARVGQYFFF